MRCDILLSIHSIGHEYRGVLASTMCFYRRSDDDEGTHEIVDLMTLPSDLFQINYYEEPNAVLGRFRRWLDGNLVKGLEMWRVGLE